MAHIVPMVPPPSPPRPGRRGSQSVRLNALAIVPSPKDPEVFFTEPFRVHLRKRACGLCFTLSASDVGGMHIARILDSAPREVRSQLRVYDEVLSFNGIDIRGMDIFVVASMFRRAQLNTTLRLVIRRCMHDSCQKQPAHHSTRRPSGHPEAAGYMSSQDSDSQQGNNYMHETEDEDLDVVSFTFKPCPQLGLGLRLTGGRRRGRHIEPITVSEILAGGPLSRTNVRVGDTLVAINGEPVEREQIGTARWKIAKAEISDQPCELSFIPIETDTHSMASDEQSWSAGKRPKEYTPERPRQQPPKVSPSARQRDVVLSIEPDGTFGVELATTLENGCQDGIFVQHIVRGSLAETTTSLCVGDEVVAVNGVGIFGMSLYDVEAMMAQSDQPQLTVQRPVRNTTMLTGKCEVVSSVPQEALYQAEAHMRNLSTKRKLFQEDTVEPLELADRQPDAVLAIEPATPSSGSRSPPSIGQQYAVFKATVTKERLTGLGFFAKARKSRTSLLTRVSIRDVAPNSSACRDAGMMVGDLLLEMDEKPLEGLSSREALDLLGSPQYGDTVTLKVARPLPQNN